MEVQERSPIFSLVPFQLFLPQKHLLIVPSHSVSTADGSSESSWNGTRPLLPLTSKHPPCRAARPSTEYADAAAHQPRADGCSAICLWKLLIDAEFFGSFKHGSQIVRSRVVNLSAAGQNVSAALPTDLYEVAAIVLNFLRRSRTHQ